MIDRNFDPHVHLHGILTPEDLLEIGKDRYISCPALKWYEEEMFHVTKRHVKSEDYWKKDNGIELLRSDFLILEPVMFARFQASFNLIIALCPISPYEFSVQKTCLIRLSSMGVRSADIRTPIPIRFSKEQTQAYILNLIQVFDRHNQEHQSDFKLVLHLPREGNACLEQLSWIELLRLPAQNILSGVDFASFEEGYPPKTKKEFCSRLKVNTPLKLFYHVGESFEALSLASSLRWIDEVQKLGPERLGHAMALGINPAKFLGKTIIEHRTEYEETLRWLKDFPNIEVENFTRGIVDCEKVQITYDQPYVDAIQELQQTMALTFKAKGVVIECCPTSNLRIGQMINLQHHPLVFFSSHKLDVVIGSDDPGIFETDLEQEYQLAEKISALTTCLEV